MYRWILCEHVPWLAPGRPAHFCLFTLQCIPGVKSLHFLLLVRPEVNTLSHSFLRLYTTSSSNHTGIKKSYLGSKRASTFNGKPDAARSATEVHIRANRQTKVDLPLPYLLAHLLKLLVLCIFKICKLQNALKKHFLVLVINYTMDICIKVYVSLREIKNNTKW